MDIRASFGEAVGPCDESVQAEAAFAARQCVTEGFRAPDFAATLLGWDAFAPFPEGKDLPFERVAERLARTAPANLDVSWYVLAVVCTTVGLLQGETFRGPEIDEVLDRLALREVVVRHGVRVYELPQVVASVATDRESEGPAARWLRLADAPGEEVADGNEGDEPTPVEGDESSIAACSRSVPPPSGFGGPAPAPQPPGVPWADTARLAPALGSSCCAEAAGETGLETELETWAALSSKSILQYGARADEGRSTLAVILAGLRPRILLSSGARLVVLSEPGRPEVEGDDLHWHGTSLNAAAAILESGEFQPTDTIKGGTDVPCVFFGKKGAIRSALGNARLAPLPGTRWLYGPVVGAFVREGARNRTCRRGRQAFEPEQVRPAVVGLLLVAREDGCGYQGGPHIARAVDRLLRASFKWDGPGVAWANELPLEATFAFGADQPGPGP